MKTQGPSSASTAPHASLLVKASPRVPRDLGIDLFQWVAAGVGSAIWAGLCLLVFWVWPAGAMAAEPAGTGLDAASASASGAGSLQGQVETLLNQNRLSDQMAGDAKNPLRVEVVLGQLDPRLRLAPCDKVKAYMPQGQRLWGRTRVGLRCEQGPVRWNVFWPVTVKVWGQGLVAAVPLRPGAPVQASDLQMAEVDLAADSSLPLTRAEELVGRYVVRGIEPGRSLRKDDVKRRRWFTAGEPVRLTIRGQGFQVASQGTALTPGDEGGQCARIRTETGRVICGSPVGERQVELSL